MPPKPYGIICPLSHACELLEPRWTIQILSALWSGFSRFNDIRRGVGHISPGLLSKRLKELEQNGLVERVEDRATGNVDYFRTRKAIELEPALNALGDWAQRNIEAELALANTNPSQLMWIIRSKLNLQSFPEGRSVIRFHFRDDVEYDTYWLLAGASFKPELCSHDPKLDIDLFVETSVLSLGGIMTGRTTVAREIDEGSLFLTGDARLARNFDDWIPKSAYASAEGVIPLQGRSTVQRRLTGSG